MKVALDKFELSNIERRNGRLRSRRGLVSVATPASGSFVGGFTVESPNTSEPWHYLIEQATTGSATLRVYTEEFAEVFSYSLGRIGKDPVISWAMSNSKMMINSPSFSAPLFGIVGGGLMTAMKQPSENPDVTTLDIPAGHVASFAGRFAIASGANIFFNEPREDDDPRAFPARGNVNVGATIYDMFQGDTGALMVFTSAGVYSIPSDILAIGQDVSGFVSRIPGLETTKPRNATASNGRTVVLQRDAIDVIGGERMPVARGGRRYWSKAVEVEDLRLAGEVYPTPDGFIVGFRGRRGHYLVGNLREGSLSYAWSSTLSFNVVGTLKTRDGEAMLILSDRVVMAHGRHDWNGSAVMAIARGRIPVPAGSPPRMKALTLEVENVGRATGVSVDGRFNLKYTQPLARETEIGASDWDAATRYLGRSARRVKHGLAARATDAAIEVRMDGGDLPMPLTVDVTMTGQGRTRADNGAETSGS